MALAARVKRAGERFLPPATKARLEEERRQAAEQAAEERRQAAEQKRLAKIAQRRRNLLDGDPTVRTFTSEDTELLGRVVDDFTCADASAHNLRLVTTALEEAGIDHFLVRGRSPLRHVVGVHRAERKRVLEAMRELYGSSALHAVKPGPQGSAAAVSAYVDGALDEQIKSALTIRFAEPLLSPAGRLLGGFEYGCDVEFWRDGSDLLERDNVEEILGKLRTQTPHDVMADSLVAPRRNRVADVLPRAERKPATLTVAGRRHPTFEPFTWTLVDEVDFPVDVVYTWVDGEDPEHAAKRARHRGDDAAATLAGNASRFTDRDELRYSLRSLRMYAPFVRHVYLVTDNQVPAWLDTDTPGLTVVDHRDIFADHDALPTFNSHAIGTRLHHIEGLSERYLYFNDDVFLARPVRAENFFHANGIAQLPFSPFQFGVGRPVEGEVAPNSAGKNVRALFTEEFGRQITHKFKHTPHPQIRQVMLDLEDKYGQEVEPTTRSRFRSLSDVGFAATMHHHYALMTGRAVPGEFRMRYVDIGAPDAQERLDRLEASAEVDFFCLNDLDTPPEAQESVNRMVGEFLQARFPFPSPYERTTG